MGKDQYKYRNELLKQYIYLAFAISPIVAPLEYFGGMRILAYVLGVFALVMSYLVFLTRDSAKYVTASRVFMFAITGLFFAGFVYSTPAVDNSYFLLLYPIASFSIRGVNEGLVWSSSLLLSFVVAFFLLPVHHSLFSFVFFGIAFFMVSYVVYYYRYYEILNFQHIGKVQEEKERIIRAKEAEAKKLETLSMTDFLTGLFNRHKLDAVLDAEIRKSHDHGGTFGIMLLDLDYFKRVNDTYGHQVGDKLLQGVAGRLRNNVRDSDIVGRWGGEEFVVISPGNDRNGMVCLAEKIRTIIESEPFDRVGQKTVSIGVTSFDKDDTVKSLIRRSDTALYRAKNNGRNRVEVS